MCTYILNKMLDYCLFMYFFQRQPTTYRFIGDYFEAHNNVLDVIKYCESSLSNDPELVMIYKEPFGFIDYFWRNSLTINTKMLIIVPKDQHDGNRIFRELRSFGDSIYIKYPQHIILIKNIKANFKDEYRKMLLNNIDFDQNLDLFLDVKIDNCKLECDTFFGNDEDILIPSMLSNCNYVYFGKEISNQNLLKNQMLSRLNFNIIHNVNTKTNETIGFFVRGDYLEKIWIYHLSKNEKMNDICNFSHNKIIVPV